ncbi:MAG TPA: NADH-quinone oxidoreductase subunit NuoE [Bacteroidales bacterium]|nr:NADH-quinone oxidoreductase subunit NuoE [Bacteroidales bacterium]HNS47520.1 NADH-quinone oxidoreductase subunit NuoE [Bacteroidales bacterium]
MKTDVKEVLENHQQGGRDSLIPILQEIQEREGYLSEEAVVAVGKHLHIPSSRIYGVATFYNQFRFQPTGKYHIQVCRGTACHVLGSATVLAHLEKLLNIKAGQTTRDGLFSIEIVACIGACGLAPVINISGEFHARVDEARVAAIIEEYRKREETL